MFVSTHYLETDTDIPGRFPDRQRNFWRAPNASMTEKADLQIDITDDVRN